MSNPFYDELEDRLRTEKIIVRKGDAVYWGRLRVWNYNQPAVLLDGAVRLGDEESEDEYVGSTFIDSPDVVETDRPTQPPIEEVPPTAVDASPYSQREFDYADFHVYVRRVRSQGHLGSFPTVRQVEDGYEVVSGHKRFEAARRAGLRSIPVFMIDEMDDWDAAVRFIDEHFPVTAEEIDGDHTGPHRGWYTPEHIEDALDVLTDRWGEDRVRDHPTARRWLDDEVTKSGETADTPTAAE